MAVSTKVLWHHRIEAWAFDRYVSHFGGMPFDRASDAGADWLARIGPLLPAHQTALRNIALAYPDESESWRQALAHEQWAQLGRVVAEYPHLPEITFEDDRATLVHGERLDAVRDGKKGAVFISGHFASFEIMPAAIVRRGVPCAMTYRPMNNPLIDQRITALRIAYGASEQAAKGVKGGVSLLRALKRGDSVALMNDQKYNEGIAAPFFGHDAMTADAPTHLALQFGVPLIPLTTRRVGKARFAVTTHEPMPLDYSTPPDSPARAAAVRDGVFAINRFLEAHVRAAPEQWFWVHRRWPKEAWAKARV